METLAYRYKWTFEDIRKLTQNEILALLKIIRIRQKIEEQEAKKKR